MAFLTSYHDTNEGCDGKTYARCGFDVPGYWTENGRQKRPQVSEGIGVEIECGTDAYGYMYNEYDDTADFVNNYLEPEIRKVFDEGFFKYQEDASIDFDHPVEIISQVFTRGWYNNGGREKLIYLFNNIFNKLDVGQNDSCGNHINISKALFINDRSAWLFDEEITNNYEYYCHIFGRTEYEGQDVDTYYYKQRAYNTRASGHYTAINWAHWNEGASARLEARIVGRANDGWEYCRYIDVIFDLIDECNERAKRESARVKNAFRCREVIDYDANGCKTQKCTEYDCAYTGEYSEEVKYYELPNEPKERKNKKKYIVREEIYYNTDGRIKAKRTTYKDANTGEWSEKVKYYNE